MLEKLNQTSKIIEENIDNIVDEILSTPPRFLKELLNFHESFSVDESIEIFKQFEVEEISYETYINQAIEYNDFIYYGINDLNDADKEKILDVIIKSKRRRIDNLIRIICRRSKLEINENSNFSFFPFSKKVEKLYVRSVDLDGFHNPDARVMHKEFFEEFHLELWEDTAIQRAIPDVLALAFTKINGLKEHILREKHGGWGYHFHYLDSRQQRSDVLMTYDKKSNDKTKPDLTWEYHAKNSNYHEDVDNWGYKKRSYIYDACFLKYKKINLLDFKTPDKEAEILWPM